MIHPCDKYGIDEAIFEQHDFVCTECKQPCRPKALDHGIGPYEFWGQKGYDSQPDVGSDCCEAPLLYLGNEYTAADYAEDMEAERQDYADYLYESRRDDELLRRDDE